MLNKVLPIYLGWNSKLSPASWGQGETKERGRPTPPHPPPDCQVAVLTRPKACLGCCRTGRSLHLSARVLKVCIEALTGFSHIHHSACLYNTLLSKGCVLDGSGNNAWNVLIHFKKREGGWGGQVQLSGQLAVTSFPRPPPIRQYSLRVKSSHTFGMGMITATLQGCPLIICLPY